MMEPEVATQFGYSLVGLLHLYHDYVLWKKDNADKEPPTAGQKYEISTSRPCPSSWSSG
jgi:hypothetical protein